MKIQLSDSPLWLLTALTILVSPVLVFAFPMVWLADRFLPTSWQSFSIEFVLLLAVASALRMLLGFWVIFLPARWWVRIGVLLAIVLWLGIWDRELSLVSIGAVLASSVVFLAIFRRKYCLAKYKGSHANTAPVTWRFSLVTLGHASTIIVLFFALPRVVAAFNDQFMLAAVLALPMAPTACWAMLRNKRLWLPATAVVGLSVGYALVFLNVENEHFDIVSHETIAGFMLHTLVLLVMFGTVRMCGYRLHRVAPSHPGRILPCDSACEHC